MATAMRIAAGGMATESCTFSPLPSELEDFNILRGADLLRRYDFAPGHHDITLLPLFHASAIPGGPVRQSAYEQLKGEFMSGLRDNGPWDGVYLDMHGAMYVAGMEDAEGDWIAAVREIVGPSCLIAASYDLHGNVSSKVIENVDLLTAYRTAPHEDRPQTRERAYRLLVRCLREGLRPHKAFVPIPVMLSGERTMTLVEPGASVYRQIEQVIDGERVMDASILVGFAWADEPRTQASVIAIGTDQTAIQDAARRLAGQYWDARHDFQFAVPTGSVDECIRMALDSPESCVFVSDSGDNVTAGGVGDVPLLLERLLAHDVPEAVFASIVDRAAVETCVKAGLGASVKVTLGGKLDSLHGQPLTVDGSVLTVAAPQPNNRHAVILVDSVKVIVTERRTAFTSLAQFTQLGINPLAHKIVCLKLGYLFSDFQRIAPKAIMALSPGAVDAVIEELPFKRIQRPMYPFDPDMHWTLP